MLFDTLRRNRPLKLAALFGFAAANASMGLPREAPALTELRYLSQTFAQNGTLSPALYMRMTALSSQLSDNQTARDILINTGVMCGHASGSGGSSGGITGAICPAERRRRRRAAGDLSHLLVFHPWV